MRSAVVSLLLLLAAATACEPTVVDQSQLLTTRVLAIRADPPELVVPSDGGLPPPVHFTVLGFVPDGGTPTVTLALCTGGNPYSADVECPGANGITLPGDTLDVSNPEILALIALDAGLPDSGLPQTEPGVLQVAIGYLATSGGTAPGDSERGVYRLSVRYSGRPNHNPQLLGVYVPDGGSLDGAQLPVGQDVVLTPTIPDGGPDAGWPSVGVDAGIETYVSLDGGVLYENFIYSWYATAPTVSYFFSREPTPADIEETPFTKFNGTNTGSVTFYVVLRDSRGGTDWKIFNLTIAP